MTRLHPTEVGRQVALSGLLPETASYLLTYLTERWSDLGRLITPTAGLSPDYAQLEFCIINACLTSPEFEGLRRTRFVPFGFDVPPTTPLIAQYRNNLAERIWQPFTSAVNATALLVEWISGASLPSLEGRYNAVRAGNIQTLARETSWCLSGLANILAAAVRQGLSPEERPTAFRPLSDNAVGSLRSLLPTIRLLVWRLNVGLPTAALWLVELQTENGERLLNRREAIALHSAGLASFEDLRKRNNWQEMIDALISAGASNANQRAMDLQQAANSWHSTLRDRMRDRLIGRMQSEDHSLIGDFFSSRERAFEGNFEKMLERAEILFTKFDDGSKPGAFDYVIEIEDRPEFIIECKTKTGNSFVDLQSARVVLSSSEQYGFGENFCVTLCQPGVDPNVPEHLQGCDRLCLVEVHDMAEALVRVINNLITKQDFCDWLCRPGVARAADLYLFQHSHALPISPDA